MLEVNPQESWGGEMTKQEGGGYEAANPRGGDGPFKQLKLCAELASAKKSGKRTPATPDIVRAHYQGSSVRYLYSR